MTPRVPLEPRPRARPPLVEAFVWGFAFGLGVAAWIVRW